MKVVIVGGVAGGASAAARLRRLDEHAEIIVLEKGAFVSFANCGLPYYIGGVIPDEDSLFLQTPQSFKSRLNIDVRVNSEVTAIDFADKHVTVSFGGASYNESYDKLILALGADPVVPSEGWRSLEGVFTLRSIPDTLKIKSYINDEDVKRVVIVGGGAIGMEMADNLKNLGIQVTVIEYSRQLIAQLDYDMACDVQNYARGMGIKLILNSAVTDLSRSDAGINVSYRAADSKNVGLSGAVGSESRQLAGAASSESRQLAGAVGSESRQSKGDDDNETNEIICDAVILSMGVRADTGLVKGTKVALNAKGNIIVDKNLQTSVADVYAVGDCVETLNYITKKAAVTPLAGPANKQGRMAADNICGLGFTYGGAQGSSILKFFDMTVASTGLNEKQLVSEGVAFDKAIVNAASHASYYPGGSMMCIKALWARDSGKLLGAQIVGFDGVDKRIDVLSTAIKFGAKASELKELELAYAPPFSNAKDPVNMVGFVAENVQKGIVKQFYVEDVAALPRDGSVTLLDVRTGGEFARGNIEGFINIPVDSLRGNLNKIKKGSTVYVHCQSGLRSYLACRILMQNGYDCYNLAGGYRLYSSVMRNKV